MNLTLPTDSALRKEFAISSGCLAYFPAAIAGVARHSFSAGAKHTGGELVHKRWLSPDHADCIARHLMDLQDLLVIVGNGGAGQNTKDAVIAEANALAWRSLALAQALHEQLAGAPLAPAARLGATEPAAPAASLGTTEPAAPPRAGVDTGAPASKARRVLPQEQRCDAEKRGLICSLPSGHGEDAFDGEYTRDHQAHPYHNLEAPAVRVWSP